MRQYITATRLMTKIKMLRSGKASKGFILVEGVTDYRFYSKFIDPGYCELLVAESKANVIQCIEDCNNNKTEGIIGIVDADFWRLEPSVPQYENLFLTDFHDLECMLINSPAYEHILTEYAHKNKYLRFEARKQKAFKNILLENGAKIGYLRWYSLQYQLGLNFNRLSFDNFTDIEELEIDSRKLINEVLIYSKKQNKLNIKLVLKEMEDFIRREQSLWDLCCGHDLMEILTFSLVVVFGEYNAKNLSPGNLEGSFRLAYHEGYFSKTQLYKNLWEWQTLNSPYKLFNERSSI